MSRLLLVVSLCIFSLTIIADPFSSAGGFSVATEGFLGDVEVNNNNNQTVNIDYKVTGLKTINGAELFIESPCFGDNVDFQVIDIDNILGYGAGVVLNQFGTHVGIAPSGEQKYIYPYRSDLVANLYIRLIYHRVCNTDTRVFTNLILHNRTE